MESVKVLANTLFDEHSPWCLRGRGGEFRVEKNCCEYRLHGASLLAIAVLQEGIVHYVQHDVY